MDREYEEESLGHPHCTKTPGKREGKTDEYRMDRGCEEESLGHPHCTKTPGKREEQMNAEWIESMKRRV